MKIANILNMANPRANWTDIWGSRALEHIRCTFDRVL